MKKSMEQVLPLAESIARLLAPMAEVVIHDLSSDKIAAIFNPISRRQVGDSSYLDRLNFKPDDTVIGPYEKINWDGRPLKSISALIKDSRGRAEGFLCINLDISTLKNFNNQLLSFLNNNAELSLQEQQLFKSDLYERINQFVQAFCQAEQTSLAALKRSQKQELIEQLHSQGAFNEKNAASYIARILGVSRATVYNYLKEAV